MESNISGAGMPPPPDAPPGTASAFLPCRSGGSLWAKGDWHVPFLTKTTTKEGVNTEKMTTLISKAAGQKECETKFKNERMKRIYKKVMT